MSSGIETPPLPPAPDAGKPPVPPPTPSERLIEERLRQTRRQVKGVDIITGLMTLLVCGSIYLFAAALADHWLFTGGLGFWGRLVLWTILLAAGGVYFVLKVWPAIVYRINPIYAAETIEKSKPSLKNSLINFLLLRGHQREVAPVVYRAMEQRAAADLNQIEIDLAVDRHGILRWLYILLAVFVIFCLYLFISPKNPLVSAGRVLWPWANVQPPTRVTIDDSVSPGDATKFNGDTMTVSAEVHGLKEGEPVLLHYSTADKQILDQTLPLTLEKGKYRHEGQLPPGNMGFQQDCTYYLSAGDCRTREFNVTVKIPPTIVVDRLDYHYPKYTGLPDRSVSRQGNISAIEGTTVDVVAVANMPIQRANLDLNCLNRFTPPMDVKDMTATGHITLKLNADGSMKPEYASYQVIFTDMDRRANSRPIQHRIDVTPDQRPEVKILEPEPEKVSVAADGKLEIRVQASDPDFALRRVAIAAECDGRKLDPTPILELKAPTPPKTGRFEGQFVFEPSKLGLKGGERVEYWAEADDNKEPTANRSTTAKKLIEILSPENRPQNDRQPRLADKNSRPGGKGDKNQPKNDRDKLPPENRPNDENNPQKDENKDAAQNNPERKQQEKGPRNKEDRAKQDEPSQANEENRPDQPPEGDQGDASQKPGGEGNANDGNQKGGKQDDQSEKNAQPPEQENRKINPDAQEGDAFQKILDDANKQKKPNQPDQENKQNADRPENKDQNDQQTSDESKNGENQAGKNNSGDKNKTDDKNSGEKKSGDSNAQQNPSEKNNAGDKNSGEKGSGDKNAEQKGNGKNDKNVEKSDQQKSGTEQAAGKKSDDPKNGQKQTGEKDDRGNKSDNKQSDPNKTGEKPTGENKPDDKNSGDKNANQKDSAQNKNGTGKSDKNQSGGKSDDKKNNDKAGGGKQGGKGSSDQNKGDENAQGDNPSGDNQSGDKNSGQKGNGKNEKGENKSDKNQPAGGKPDEKNSGDKSTGENPTGEQNADANQNSDNAQGKKSSDKNAGDKNSAQKGAGQKNKNDADKSGQNAQAGDKSDDQKTGDKVSEGNKSDQKPSEMNPTGKGDSGKKNPGDKNSAEKNSAEKNGGDQKPPTENAGDKGTDKPKSADKSEGNSQPAGRDKLNDPQEKAGAGKPSSDKGPSPESQGENKANKNVKPGGDPSKSDEEKSDKAQSPGQSENKSDSQGENEGDKSGGGGKGGSQKSNQAGKGSAGTHTPSDDNGGKASEEKGQGEIGNTPGKDAQSSKPDGTGEKRKSDSGQPSNDPGDGSKSSDDNSQNGHPSEQSPDGGKGDNPSPNEPGGQASGNPTGGGKSDTGANGPDAPAVETGGDEVNMDYARKQTELALRHLEDEMSKDKSELLDKLGWTKEDAKRFLERWQQLRRDARTAGPKGDEAKKNLEDALKSLGLRPTTTKIRHGSTSRDRDRGLHDAGRSAPPADWAEQFQQYQRSMAEEKK